MDSISTWEGANRVRLDRAGGHGHYESFFHRANHPTEPRAFWIRYTAFSPAGRPDAAVGECWAIFFDGSARRIAAAKDSFPLAECSFSSLEDGLRIGGSTLDGCGLKGLADGPGGTIEWDLEVEGDRRPILLLPRPLYDAGFPKAKSLIPVPRQRHDGELRLGNERIPIDGWLGSQNHNWGSRHTDRYAWAQVVGFDDEPDSFLEVATARVRVGPVWTPFMTLLVLRLGDELIELNGLWRAIRARSDYRFFRWGFETGTRGVRVRGSVRAPPDAFVALRYGNPPGGSKTCLNSKIAACDLEVARAGQPTVRLTTRNRAAFEILTDDDTHGRPVCL